MAEQKAKRPNIILILADGGERFETVEDLMKELDS